MRLAMVGLGRMGGNMVRRLQQGGHTVVAYDRDRAVVDAFAAEGAEPAYSLDEVVSKLRDDAGPVVVWVMVPSGAPTQLTLEALGQLLRAGDVIVDGGNSNYKDSQGRAAALAERGIHLLDCGTSGGVWGLEVGYCMMIGGAEVAFKTAEPIFATLAPKDGYLYTGASGSGHFTKMVHNGIEYGMLQAYGEGFELLEKSPFELDLRAVAHLWNQGSVIRSWLLELAERAFAAEGRLESIRGYVEDSGEGRWTVQTAIEYNVPAPVITLSLMQRFASRQEESFAAQVVAALRNQFGGHAVHTDAGRVEAHTPAETVPAGSRAPHRADEQVAHPVNERVAQKKADES